MVVSFSAFFEGMSASTVRGFRLAGFGLGLELGPGASGKDDATSAGSGAIEVVVASDVTIGQRRASSEPTGTWRTLLPHMRSDTRVEWMKRTLDPPQRNEIVFLSRPSFVVQVMAVAQPRLTGTSTKLCIMRNGPELQGAYSLLSFFLRWGRWFGRGEARFLCVAFKAVVQFYLIC